MALSTAVKRRIMRPIPISLESLGIRQGNGQARSLTTSKVAFTDGVYGDLTAMRVRTPWIVAFNAQREKNSLVQEADNGESSKSALRPVTQRTLAPRSMSDSFHRVVIPIAQDPWLGDTYLNATGHIRIGTIFMDLDALAGVIAYKFTGDSVTTVTAAVDRITLKHPMEQVQDLELSGQVTYATGRSSMEISLQVSKAPKTGEKVQEKDIYMTCAFTMVSLDPKTKKPVAVNPLRVESDAEKRLYALGERNYQDKRASAKTELKKVPPNDGESSLIHDMWLKTDPIDAWTQSSESSQSSGRDMVTMQETILPSSQIMQPQFRNRHNFMIFGGYLLKQTFELAFTCAASISHCRPAFVSLDPSTFDNPVPVGSVLYLSAMMVYTTPDPRNEESTLVQIRVLSKVRSIEHQDVKSTGEFHYTFTVSRKLTVQPRLYNEYMAWIDGRRRAQRVQEIGG